MVMKFVVIWMLLAMALYGAPRARGQCGTYIVENGPCANNGADDECCDFLSETTASGPHVDSVWCVCQALLVFGAPATYLNDCGVVEGSEPYC